MTRTRFAPAPRASRTSVATTSGFVVAAYFAARAWQMLGLMTTSSPELTKRRMPPSLAIAVLTLAVTGAPWTTVM